MAGNMNWAAEINGDEDDDEALRLAIALSLGRDPGEREERPSAKAGVVDLTQDSDDGSTTDSGDDLVEVDGGAGPSQPVSSSNNPPAPPPPPETPTLSALGLDRRKMEEERLARLSKRKASQLAGDVPPPPRPTQRPKTDHAPPPPSAATSLAKQQKEQLAVPPTAPSSSSAPAPRSTHLPFPQGVVKKTWAYGQPRQGDDIKIEEVLQKQQLELAVLSSFQWDEEWLLAKVDLARTKLILVAFASGEAQVRDPFFWGGFCCWWVCAGGWFANGVFLAVGRGRRCGPMCPATGSGSVSRPCSTWGRCTPS